ncbi:MAG: hypothetical protein JW795_10935 [Chitinivibrionales bacterium]|nr:hypothetical protein [Chitinivibrionales bacterium]
MYQLTFYVPESHLETVKTALFRKGGGAIGTYDQCCWQIRGQGQFRPGAGSVPTIGSIGVTEHLDEYKVEMVCSDSCVVEVVKELLAVHPYETVAYAVIKLHALEELHKP